MRRSAGMLLKLIGMEGPPSLGMARRHDGPSDLVPQFRSFSVQAQMRGFALFAFRRGASARAAAGMLGPKLDVLRLDGDIAVAQTADGEAVEWPLGRALIAEADFARLVLE